MLNKIKTLGQALSAKAAPKKQSSLKYLVGLDVGTEFVKALVAKVNGDKLEIAGMGRTHQDFNDMQAGAIADIAAVVANCNIALNQAEQQSGVSIRTAVLGIAGELVKGTTTSV